MLDTHVLILLHFTVTNQKVQYSASHVMHLSYTAKRVHALRSHDEKAIIRVTFGRKFNFSAGLFEIMDGW